MVSAPNPRRQRARLVFFFFTLTFIASRVLVILIMTKRMPDLFLHVGGNHVHHLNYGIVLLSLVGGLMLFADLSDSKKRWVACAYGLGMALTFDEFGMWLHLGGSYWQRASYDAIIVVAALFGLFAFVPRRDRIGARHWTAGAITAAAVLLFCWLSFTSLNIVDRKMGDRLRQMEQEGAQ